MVDVEEIGSLAEAKWLAKHHRYKYRRTRPHSHLDYAIPAKFTANCLAPRRPTVPAAPNSNTQPILSQSLVQKAGQLNPTSRKNAGALLGGEVKRVIIPG